MESGHLSEITAVTGAAYLQDRHESERVLEEKRLIEFRVYVRAQSPALPPAKRLERQAKEPRLSCTSLPKILAGSFPRLPLPGRKWHKFITAFPDGNIRQRKMPL